MIDVEKIPLPDRIQDVFNTFPTLNIGRMASIERMRMNKIMAFKEEILLKDAAEEFDNEVSQSIEEHLGHERRMPNIPRYPDPDFIQNDNFVTPFKKRQNLGYDDLDENMI